jgi:1,4-dihydroxy-2-naphthoyl-CoA hydrolase
MPDINPDELNTIGQSYLPGHLGIRITGAGSGWMEGEFHIAKHHMAPNGFLHAGSIVTLADSLCGFACMRALPDGAGGFTTIELKSNFLGTAREGKVTARAEARHLGRTTQLWDASVAHADTAKTIALFRCTQMVLWPK